MPTIYLVKSSSDDDKHTIFLRCPHDMTDYTGITMLLQDLFAKATRFCTMPQPFGYPLPDDDLFNRLAPCLREAVCVQEVPAQGLYLYNYFAENNQLNRDHRNSDSLALSLPPSSTTNNDRIKRIAITVSELVSSTILHFEQFVYPYLFTAALAMALCDSQNRTADHHAAYYFDRSIVNLRPMMRRRLIPGCGDIHYSDAAALYQTFSTQALMLNLGLPKEGNLNNISQVTSQVQQHYGAVFDAQRPLGENPEAMIAPRNFMALYPPPDFNDETEPPVSPVSFVPIGYIQPTFTSDAWVFDTSKVWVASQPVGKNGIVVYLSIYKYQIELSAVYNTRYHDEGAAESLLKTTLNHVCDRLGIGAGPQNITKS